MKNNLLLLVLLFNLVSSKAQTWSIAADIPEAIRAGNAASYSKNGDGYLFIASGRNQDGIITTRHQKYELSSDIWTDLAPTPTPIIGASTAIVRDTLYLIGGLVTTPGSAIRKVRKYSINENTWSDARDFPINIVDSDAVAYQDSLIYVAAGYSNRVRVFNTITNTWRLATSFPTTQTLSWGALTLVGNKLIYMCGATGFQSSNYFNTVRIGTIDQNNRANITWTLGTPFPGNTRTFFDAHPWGNGIIMSGGSTDNTFETHSDECYYYDVDTDTWHQLPSKPTAWLTGNSGSVQMGNTWKLICSSGYQSPNYLYSTEIYTDDDVLAIEIPKASASVLQLMPNPAQDLLHLKMQGKPKQVTVYDVIGKKIEVRRIDDETLNVSILPAGVYWIQVIDDRQILVSGKFIKQ
ncbi:T9SS type A sorting domain-containing protein [Flavobacterium sp. CYK-4]|uniref:T9SS type A sorting domain-containing protein n=1 Tax=Flavobacterium lotistagni TaxID=2709660 RepID=UPI00140C6419|nr:T9SS type A sorting domain-containing protein [Flavobacterium lotistagni]NHM07578.1 T9SS type A sorting domain-containing protein [Flavobacterium lotistagni]